MIKEPFMKVKIDGRRPEETERDDFELPNKIFLEEVRKKHARIDWMHLVTHAIAIIVVASFLGLLVYDVVLNPCNESSIPIYFVSIVSTIIGFYFAERLFHKKII